MPEPVWQEGIGSLLLLAAAHQTGLLATLDTTIEGVATATPTSGLPLNPAVIERLLLTLLFLPVAGLARTWDLRTYTGTLLALVTGRGCAYSYAYVEQFLSCLAHAQVDEGLGDCRGAALLASVSRWQHVVPLVGGREHSDNDGPARWSRSSDHGKGCTGSMP